VALILRLNSRWLILFISDRAIHDFIQLEGAICDKVRVPIKDQRVTIDQVEVGFQAFITSVITMFQSLEDSLEAHTHWNMVPIERIDLKIYIVYEKGVR
jgi:hypothetical protein